MKTVREFKAEGLEFVNGDLVISTAGPSEYWKICAFAWRTNIGKHPGFIGLVQLRNAYTKSPIHTDDVHWGAIGEQALWRPVISEEDKMEDELAAIDLAERMELANDELNPIYTQAMHDAGELPPIGSEFMLAKKINCQRLDQFQGFECDVIGHCKNLDGEDVITFSHPTQGLACMRHIPEYIKPIDTRTDEEKKLAEWILVMSKADSTSIDEKAKATLKWLGVNGYRKQQEK